MRVLMVGPARNVNGGISAVVNNYYKAGLDKKIELDYIGTMGDGSKWNKLKIAICALIRFVLQVAKYDLVHIHMASDVSIYRKMPFIWITKMFRKKLVIQQHGGNIQQFYYHECGKVKQNLIKKTIEQADVLLVVASYLKDIFKEIVDENKIIVFPNAIEIPKNLIKDYSEQKILFLGRLCKEKGIGELLDAVNELKCDYPKLQLYLGGIWVDKELEIQADSYKEYVHHLGWIGETEKAVYLQKCNLFLLPTYFEGLPMSLLEAMAYGCACIASEVGGIPQVLTDGGNGMMIPPKNSEAIKEAIRKLLDNREKQELIGNNAKKTIEEKYDICHSVSKLIKIYNNL